VKSLLHKLLLSSWLIILLPMGLAIFWTSQTLSLLLERRFTEKSRAQAQQVELLLSEKKEIATGLVHWIAEMPGVRENLQRKNRDALFQHLLPAVGSIEMDFIEILDADGKIFLRVHDPSRFGDRPPLSKDIQEILQGKQDFASYGIEERDGKAYLRATESIQGRRIAGVVSVGYALGPDFIKKLQLVSGGQVVVTLGDRLYTEHGPGPKPPGTAAAPSGDSGGDQAYWHRSGPASKLEIRIPLERSGQNPGVLSLFFPSQELTSAIGTLQKTLFSVALVGMLLAFSVSWLLSRRLTKPLKELAQRTEQVAAGDYNGTVYTASRDEIGILANSFNRMVQELARSKAEVDRYRQELERKFAERGKELAETETKRAAMAHMIAHDLKNPLLGIKKTLERLERTFPPNGEESAGRIVSDLLSASDLVMGMVNEMLDLYRSDYGDLPLSLTRFDIEEPVHTSLRVLRPELDEKNLQVQSLFQPPQIAVVADKRRLTRLLTNLLSNAIKFSPDHGRIRVSASRSNDQDGVSLLSLRIEDEGSGMAEEELPRLFERFYSRDGQRGEIGTGLGLPYCQLVAEAHRGRIFAENRHGGGFVVSVLLPIVAPPLERIDAIEGFDRG
jgi:signal transduction histidine kinase